MNRFAAGVLIMTFGCALGAAYYVSIGEYGFAVWWAFLAAFNFHTYTRVTRY